MNQILLTGDKASKCRSKIEKRKQRREARKLIINKFKLILKDTAKSIVKADYKALLKNVAKSIASVSIKSVLAFKTVGKLALKASTKIITIGKNIIKLPFKAGKKVLMVAQNAVKLLLKVNKKLVLTVKYNLKEQSNNIKTIIEHRKQILNDRKQLVKEKKQIIKEKTEKQKKVVFEPMSQILISSEKAIIPIRNRLMRVYKVGLVFSIICSVTFGGLSAYATYDRNKSEEISKEILENIVLSKNEKTEGINQNVIADPSQIKKITSERIMISADTVVVILNKDTNEPKINIEDLANKESEISEPQNYIEVNLADNGETYYIIATISIPKINVNYPVLSETSDTLLKISPCKYWGGEVNSVGNLCIMGHNYVNSQFFSKVPSLVNGDIIELTDIQGNTMTYSVYDKYQIADDDMSCTSQMTDGNIDLTLITCTNNGKRRVVVKARTQEI